MYGLMPLLGWRALGERGRELTSVWPYIPSGMEGTGGRGRELTSVWPYAPSGMEGTGGEGQGTKQVEFHKTTTRLQISVNNSLPM